MKKKLKETQKLYNNLIKRVGELVQQAEEELKVLQKVGENEKITN